MFLIVFSLALVIANIYCFVKKKYLNVFIPGILFLPEYYGIELTQTFPVISVSRIMFLIFYVYVFLNRKNKIQVRNIELKSMPKSYWLLLGYFIIRIVANLRYVLTYSFAAKTIFSLVLEEALLLIGLFLLSPTADEIISVIKTVVWCACALFVVGICESVFSIRPFDALYTVSRDITNSHYVRLGLLRSVTTMGLANYFGNFCLLMVPLIIYLLKKTRERKYILVLFLDFLAMLHSGCRSDIILFFFLIAIYLLLELFRREDKKFLLRSFAIFLAGMAVYAIVIGLFSEKLSYYYTGTAKAVLNAFGFEFDLNESVPEGMGEYGSNAKGALSRMAQLTGIKYVLETEPVFGLGRGCQIRGDVYYFYEGEWSRFKTMDMGIVEVVCAEGLTGTLAYALLFVSFLLILFKQRKNKNTALDFTTYCLLAFTYLLSTLSTVNMTTYLMLIAALLFSIENDPLGIKKEQLS